MLYNCGPRLKIDFPLKTLTISLLLFFKGLLGDNYMPFLFKNIVRKLRSANNYYMILSLWRVNYVGGERHVE
jgi:hypothetical protein